jgi:OFA family oxalate/formate antiporter-like MFS transporter
VSAKFVLAPMRARLIESGTSASSSSANASRLSASSGE